MKEKIIDLKSITKKYKGLDLDNKSAGIVFWIISIFKLTSNKSQSIVALKDVSFDVKKGEIFGIFGSNGAGKTTLVKILSGLLYPTSGSINVNGYNNINDIKSIISYISTNGWMGLEWQLTAKENLIYYGNMFGLFGKSLSDKCDDVLKELDMYDAKDKYIAQLSAGMRQKITISRGLILDKPIIYLDEPSVNLDVNSSKKLRRNIQEYVKTNNRTAIITSHNPEDLYICDRIMFLYKGKVIANGSIRDLKKPLNNFRILAIKCRNFEKTSLKKLQQISNVKSASLSSIEGKREYQEVKISIDKHETTTGNIIDFFIDNHIYIFNMNIHKISLNEVYEYYINRSENE